MIVRELLTMLGFKVDEHSLSETEKTIDGLKEAAEHLVELYASWEAAKKLYEMVSQTAELGEETLRTSIKLGIGADALQEFQFAANQAGTSAGGLEAGLRFLSRNAMAAAQGGGKMSMEFQKLGVSVNDAHGELKPVDQLMMEVSDGLKNMTNKTERTAMAIKIFGRGGLQMLPFLIEGSAKIKEQRQEAEALGGVMGGELLEQSERYIQAQKKLSFAWQGMRNIVAKTLLPVFEKSVNAIKNWILANRKLFQEEIPKAILAIVRLSSVLGGLVKMAGDGWVMIGKLVYSFGSIGRGALIAAGAITVLALAFASPTVAIGLFLAALALVAEDLQFYAAGKESAFGHLVEWISKMNAIFLETTSTNPLISMLQSLDAVLVNILTHAGEFKDSIMEDITDPMSAIDTAVFGPHSIFSKLNALKGAPLVNGMINQSGQIMEQGAWREHFAPQTPYYGFETDLNHDRTSMVSHMKVNVHIHGNVNGTEADPLANLIARRVGEITSVHNIQAASILKSKGKS